MKQKDEITVAYLYSHNALNMFKVLNSTLVFLTHNCTGNNVQ